MTNEEKVIFAHLHREKGWRTIKRSYTQISADSGIKTRKKSSSSRNLRKKVLAHECWFNDQYAALQWHRTCYFIWGTVLAWGVHFSSGGTQAVIWGHGPEMPPWRQACYSINATSILIHILAKTDDILQRWSPRGHILKSLALKPQVLENCPVVGPRTAVFLNQKPYGKSAKTFFWFPRVEIA